ncbi:uncharacterized protein LOC106662060 isoform X3 [Cimex lectularius]|nr:uncharacterized protein LOC106662060 isoform X3 [Cimex lectularius]
MNLLEVMEKYGCKKIIYSSSATVYGIPDQLPLSETDLAEASSCSNPYGKTKRMTEEIMMDICAAFMDDSKKFSRSQAIARAKAVVRDVFQAINDVEDYDEDSENVFVRAFFKWYLRNRKRLPLNEKAVVGSNLAHKKARSTYTCEEILKDVVKDFEDWGVISLRYFNPVGAHPSGLIGEDPNGVPNNLMPYITRVAAKRLDRLVVFGGDYPTRDGTGVRDYIHIMDLIDGHMKALDKIIKMTGFKVYNLGTGRGYSVLEVIKAFSEENKVHVPYVIEGRREGDVAESYCDASLALRELDWIATRTLREMCADAWKFQCKNPQGYLTPRDPECLVHSPQKLRKLLNEITAVELARAERKLEFDKLQIESELKKKEEQVLVTELRRRLREAERLKQSTCTNTNSLPFCYDCPPMTLNKL